MGESYLSMAAIPLLVAIGTLYYAFRMLVFKDPYAVRGKKEGKVKDEKEYAKRGGFLMLFLSIASFGMAGIMYFDLLVALVEIVVAFVIYGTLWRNMEEKYGR